jgi:hypothetical protein
MLLFPRAVNWSQRRTRRTECPIRETPATISAG